MSRKTWQRPELKGLRAAILAGGCACVQLASAAASADEPEGTAPEPESVEAVALPAEEPAGEAAPAVLDEIVVTAQKRKENIQAVPLSITAIGGDDIAEKNMGDMNEVANYVPNLDVLAIPTFPSVYMRGLGSSYNRGFEQSVAILIDEVFYGRASYINQGLLDLAAIEVLRGPQGTLFGKNSSAGAIHFRTAEPEHEPLTRGDALFGALDLQRYRLVSTGPAGDDLAWRVALLHETRDGGVYNTTTGIDEENRDNQGGRLRLQWDPRDDLGIGLSLNASVVHQHGAGSQLIRARDRHLAAMRVFDEQTSADPYDEKSALDHAAGTAREAYDATVKADWTLGGDHVITSISNYAWLDELVDFDADFSPVPFLILDNNEALRQFSQELRFTSAPGDLEFVAGLYYLRTDIAATYDITDFLELNEILQITGEGERRACINGPDPQGCQDAILDDSASGQAAGESIQSRMNSEGVHPVESALTRFAQLTDSSALFGQFTWHATERLSLTAGGRLNYEEKTLGVVHRLLNHETGEEGNAVLSGDGSYRPGPNPQGSTIFPVIIAGDTQFSAQRTLDDFNVIPKISSQYEITDAAMTYVSAARGYKSGGFNAQPVNEQQLQFDEEDAVTYETGLKSSWLGGAARVNLAAFRTQFDGLQVATFNGVSYVVGNAASAIVQGLEYEGLLLVGNGLLLGLNGAWTDARYDQFPTAPCSAEDTAPPPCDLGGRRLRLVPDLKTTFTGGWQAPLFSSSVGLRMGVTASHTTDVALATDLDPVDIREPGVSYGVQLGLLDYSRGWHVTVFGDNIANHKSLAGAQDAPAFRGTHFGGAYPTATWELEVGYDFRGW